MPSRVGHFMVRGILWLGCASQALWKQSIDPLVTKMDNFFKNSLTQFNCSGSLSLDVSSEVWAGCVLPQPCGCVA